MAPPMHDARAPMSHNSHLISSRSKSNDDDQVSLFGDIPESKKRKFIVVNESAKNKRVRVQVSLDGIDQVEMPDSFRKSNAVYPRSWYPMEMQDAPPSGHGRRFFDADDEDDGGPRARRSLTTVPVPLMDGAVGEVGTPRMRRGKRGNELRLNELAHRMAWSQSRMFHEKPLFLQKALDVLRSKSRLTLEKLGEDMSRTPHFETRVGKRRWNERTKADRKMTRA